MEATQHVSFKFGNLGKIRTEQLYTREQALEIRQIVAKTAEIAFKHRAELIPVPIDGEERE